MSGRSCAATLIRLQGFGNAGEYGVPGVGPRSLPAVMPRLDRGIQYAEPRAGDSALRRRSLEYWVVRSGRTTTEFQNEKAGRGPAVFKNDFIQAGCPGGAQALPGLEGYFLAFLVFLAFFAFFAFFAFLAIVNPLRVQWMETRHEGCSAEGQPRNILECNPSRFAGRCPALSRRCHCVIHSCYGFLSAVLRKSSRAIDASPPATTPDQTAPHHGRLRFRVNEAPMRGLMLRPSGTAAAHLHDFKTTVRIAGSAVRVR